MSITNGLILTQKELDYGKKCHTVYGINNSIVIYDLECIGTNCI